MGFVLSYKAHRCGHFSNQIKNSRRREQVIQFGKNKEKPIFKMKSVVLCAVFVALFACSLALPGK